MSESLVVHLNRGGLYDIDPAATAFEATGPFEVELRNHGQAVHAHLRLDEALSRVAALEGPNHFVDTGSTTVVRVGVVDEHPPVEGTLTVVTGYGSDAEDVDVRIAARDGGRAVEEDPEPERPRPREGAESLAARLPGDGRATAVVALAVVALALAGAAGLAADSPAVLLGVLVVLVGVGVAAYLLAS